MHTSSLRQTPMMFLLWLRSYRRSPLRLVLVMISICASALTFVTGMNLSEALDRAKPAAAADAYLMLAAGAGTEMRSFIPLSAYEQLRTGFSASPALRSEPLHAALVLPADIVLGELDEDRVPALMRGLPADDNGGLAGLTLIEGRLPLPGRRELLLSPALNAWVAERKAGPVLKLGHVEWRVVGVAQRAGVSREVEMYSTLPALEQHFEVSDMVSSVSMTLDPVQLAEVRRLSEQVQGSRFELLQLNDYGGRFVAHLQSQLNTFWIAFLVLTVTCTGFGIHTIALALEIERDRVRQIVLQLGFLPLAVRLGEIAEGCAIGIVAAGLAVLLYALFCHNLQLQSLLPSGAISIGLPASPSGVVLTLVMGAAVGACTFAWLPAQRAFQDRQR
ncbi:hypothetical protein F2P45_22995 [Massilia sp. CCM 8733]|uniref:ABC transporter permease n=1 Tax=Massilia mucilaginosa TaxID=2609282 RepID=A0ABX0NYR2_9BURK|nr:hypothetical protein [Massilia mucilaginosa]NHZ91849.1 hypothetical protein [Massilia mucilaginosa]